MAERADEPRELIMVSTLAHSHTTRYCRRQIQCTPHLLLCRHQKHRLGKISICNNRSDQASRSENVWPLMRCEASKFCREKELEVKGKPTEVSYMESNTRLGRQQLQKVNEGM
eukprot:scaffold17861_cov33-Prasinocladus_malaysianus.AAC.1